MGNYLICTFVHYYTLLLGKSVEYPLVIDAIECEIESRIIKKGIFPGQRLGIFMFDCDIRIAQYTEWTWSRLLETSILKFETFEARQFNIQASKHTCMVFASLKDVFLIYLYFLYPETNTSWIGSWFLFWEHRRVLKKLWEQTSRLDDRILSKWTPSALPTHPNYKWLQSILVFLVFYHNAYKVVKIFLLTNHSGLDIKIMRKKTHLGCYRGFSKHRNMLSQRIVSKYNICSRVIVPGISDWTWSNGAICMRYVTSLYYKDLENARLSLLLRGMIKMHCKRFIKDSWTERIEKDGTL